MDRLAAQRAIDRFLEALGFDRAADPELRETPERVAKAFVDELLRGYRMDANDILSDATNARTRDLVALTHVHVSMICPHHLLPATGIAHVAYVPGEKVVGIGSLGRLIECFSARLTLQEDFCNAVVESLMACAGARGALCICELEQGCVVARGQRLHGSRTVTVATRGLFEQDKWMNRFYKANLAPDLAGARRPPREV